MWRPRDCMARSWLSYLLQLFSMSFLLTSWHGASQFVLTLCAKGIHGMLQAWGGCPPYLILDTP